MVFGLAADPGITADIEATGRKTAVLVGLETDVCVTHSALGLLERGYRVVVLADATGSPGTAHNFGLQRMRAAGVILSSVKSIFYEWIRTVPAAQALEEEAGGEIEPPMGIIL
jgi:nicotinamidase-related amidase